MVKRLAALALVLGLLPTSAFAQSLQDSIKKEATALTQQQRQSSAKADNRYEVPAYLLMGTGAGLSLIALLAAPSLNCGTSLTSACTTSHHTVLLVTGLGMVGAGGFLLFKGKSSPQIAATPGGLWIGKRIQF